MSSNNSFSLFDSSSHKPHKKVRPPEKAKPKLPEYPVAPKFEGQPPPMKRELDPEVTRWIEKIKALQTEISEKMDLLIEKQGHTPTSIKRYLSDRQNFTAQEWITIESKRDELEKSLGFALDPQFKKIKKVKDTEASTKKRKGKTLGGRKNWLDMR